MRKKIFRAMAAVIVCTLLCCGTVGFFVEKLPLFLLLQSCVIAGGFLAAWLVSRYVAQSITAPLNDMDLEKPLESELCPELNPLVGRINQQYIEVSTHLRMLRRKTGQFEQIIRNMQEGLILLDSETTILSINPAARSLFDTDGFCIGKSIFSVEPGQALRDAVNDALDHGHAEMRLQKNGRQYQLDLSRIESDGAMAGAVILAIDVTDAVNAELNRREFSANVSHELKTPLQSIIGSAELMESGLVKPEDMAQFIGRIRKEARRLVTLVQDIIRLSQLDEGVPMPTEQVSLLTLSREVAEQLSDAASSKAVTVTVQGEDVQIPGVRRLLHEIVYNLCDNAIQYNVSGGTVTVTVTGGGHPALCVRDTGIGIPPEHQGRVFERFYRVDKSHSRESGGTGLGLSIVKHAAQYHNARLSLESTLGQGTAITVHF